MAPTHSEGCHVVNTQEMALFRLLDKKKNIYMGQRRYYQLLGPWWHVKCMKCHTHYFQQQRIHCRTATFTVTKQLWEIIIQCNSISRNVSSSGARRRCEKISQSISISQSIRINHIAMAAGLLKIKWKILMSWCTYILK